MAPQPHGLLVHGDLVGVDGGLLQDPLLVDGGGLQHLPHLGRQLLPVLPDGLRGPLLHLGGHALDGAEPPADVLRQLLALHGPHGVVGGQRLVQHGAEVGADGLQVLVRLGDGEDIREPGQLLGGHALLPAADGGESLKGLGVLGREGGVHVDLRHVRRRGVHADEDIHLPPGDRLLHPGLHGVLGEGVHPGHLHGTVQIAVVDTADLHGDIPEVPGGPGAAIACHTLDQS